MSTHEDDDFHADAALAHKLHTEQQARETEPINARGLATPVYILEMHYQYEGTTLIGVYATVDEAKADANRGIYGDSQTICECTGGRLMKQVARREQLRADGKYQYGLWL